MDPTIAKNILFYDSLSVYCFYSEYELCSLFSGLFFSLFESNLKVFEKWTILTEGENVYYAIFPFFKFSQKLISHGNPFLSFFRLDACSLSHMLKHAMC